MLLFIIVISLLQTSYTFLHFKQGSPFSIKNRELKQKIVCEKIDNNPIDGLSGFYGLIGPDIDKFSIKSFYDLITGDGIIQGVFFDEGNITFIKHFVRTEKLLYEEQYGRFSKKIAMTSIYLLMNHFKMLPNVLGLANTAILNIGTKTVALFERDLPYEIDIDFINKQVRTIEKIKTDELKHFSGHSKYIDNNIHTIDYNVLSNKLSYIILNNKFQEINKAVIKTTYIPIIHDFTVLKNNLFFIDSPFIWNPFSKFPVSLSKKPTYIHVYNTHTKMRTQYQCDTPFYLFHYADIIETNKTIEIYGSQYDSIDFSSLNLQGKYRKIVVNLISGNVFIIKNSELENMNLDFPLKWKQYTLLRSIENQIINGFVLCRGLDIIKKLYLPQNRYFCGEPSIVEISGSPFLIGFSYDSAENGYLVLLELFTEKYTEIPLNNDIKLTIGFHSIFLHK